jgi:succinoglycan biosynthesis protein ExoA
VIIPCLDEERTIGGLLAALAGQTFPAADMEVLVVDGGSRDGTVEIVRAVADRVPAPRIRLLDNPDRSIPCALNIGIREARAPVVVRMDAHAVPDTRYVERSVRALGQKRGDVVGGVWDMHALDPRPVARAIASAAGSPIAVGDALYRFARHAAKVDTVPFGAYLKDMADALGGYDETLPVNEDYEFNARVRARGGTVWMDPAIRSRYVPRASFRALARQYARYGFWKAEMLTRHPGTIRARQALPPAFVAVLAILAVASTRSPRARGLLALQAVPYLGALAAAGLDEGRRRHDVAVGIGMPAAAATMHAAYGLGFLARAVRGWRHPRTSS